MRNRNKIEKRQAEVRALELEYQKLQLAKWNLGYTDLPKPLRNGLTRSLVLRDDISRRKDAFIYQEILKACKYYVWGRDRKHLNKNWEKYHSNKRDLVYPGIKLLNSKSYNSLSHKARLYFIPVNISLYHGFARFYYCLLSKYHFVSKYERSYLTKQKIEDPAIDKRMQEIDLMLISNKYYNLSWYGFSNRNEWNPRCKEYLFLKENDLSLRRIMREFNNESKSYCMSRTKKEYDKSSYSFFIFIS